jgi:hypothetical protein
VVAVGAEVTVTACDPLLLPHVLVMVNVTLPDTADTPQVVVMELVP